MYRCPSCGKRFAYLTNVPVHYKMVHMGEWIDYSAEGEKKIICKICGARFRFLHGLKIHLSRCEDEEHMLYAYLILSQKGRRGKAGLREVADKHLRI